MGSHVLAAYASFLWETEDDEESTEEDKRESQDLMGVVKADGAIASSAWSYGLCGCSSCELHSYMNV